ncbi:MAG: hypothetical protein K6G50_07370 [bacterium]|nr:hypothetical protein [bacterium]
MPANIQEMLANELTDTQVLIVLIPLVLVMLFVGWIEKKAGLPDYKKLVNGHKGWGTIQMLPPQSCALLMSALPAADAEAYISAGCTAPQKLLSLREKLLDEFMDSWPQERKISSGSSVKEKEAAWISFATSDTNEAAKLILSLWPPEHAAAEAMPEASPSEAETTEAAASEAETNASAADTMPEASPAEAETAETAATEAETSASAADTTPASAPAEENVTADPVTEARNPESAPATGAGPEA